MKNRRSFWKGFAGYVLGAALVGGTAWAATFNLFQPSTGILKGDANSYITTPAGSTDVRALWSGTCDNTTYLRGDGSCQTPPGAGGGSVNSVSLTAPSVFGVTGSPVTNSGTLALTFATGQTQNRVLASPNGSSGAITLRALVGADLPAIDLTTGVTGILPGANGGTANGFTAFTGPTTSLKTFTLPNATATILTSASAVTVAQGGTGAATLTGLIKGNGTAAFTAAAASDVAGLFTGTCNAGTYLSGAGTCVAAAGSGTVTSVGFSAPSVFTTAGSPVTTSGTLAFTFANGQTANSVLATPNGSTGALGLRTLVGADIPQINIAASGNGGVTGNLPVANLNGGTSASSSTFWRGDGTWSSTSTSGTFTGTLTGMTTSPTCSMGYQVNDKVVTLWNASGALCTGTSNTSGFSITGLPAGLYGSSPHVAVPVSCSAIYSGQASGLGMGCAVVQTTGTLAFSLLKSSGGTSGNLVVQDAALFGTTSTKGLPLDWSATYVLP